MLNPTVRERVSQIELTGPALLNAFDELVGVAKKAGSPDAILLLSYAGRGDKLTAGEYVAEIHLIVKKVPKQEEDV